MYYFKTEQREEILQGKSQRYIARQLDATDTSISQILTGKWHTTGITAYAITKAIDVNAKVEDYFIKKEK